MAGHCRDDAAALPSLMSSQSRIDSRGRITIPAAIRRQANLSPGIEVDIGLEDGAVTFRVGQLRNGHRGERLVTHMRGRGDVLLTTDEIMALTR